MMLKSNEQINLSSIITALYRILLMREPDSAGLRAHLETIKTNSANVEDIFLSFLKSSEFQVNVPHFLETYIASCQSQPLVDHSQFGEFSILLRHIVNDAAHHRIVVDVGARGKDRSNSFDLLQQYGWKGLLIEANPALIPSIQKEFSGLDFVLLNFAVSDYDGTADLYMGVNEDVSSLNADATAAWGRCEGKVAVEVRRLASTLTTQSIPRDFDLLSLDIEGEDIKVLNDLLDGGYCPTWIIIEASYNYQTRSLEELPFSETAKSSYKIVGQTKANLVLKRTL